MVQTIIITFIYLLALFIVQNLKKILTANPEVRGYIIFGPQMFHLLQFFFFFFLKKIISFSSTYWPLSFCEILKKFLKPIQIYEDVLFSDPKYPNLSWTKFLVQTIIITFIYLLALFIGQNLKKKILAADPELWGCTIFGPKIVHLPQTKSFLENY